MLKQINYVIERMRTGFSAAILCLFFILLVSASSFAQEPPGGDEGGDPADVPIDGGISLLVAAGAAYGIKKVRDFKNAEKESG